MHIMLRGRKPQYKPRCHDASCLGRVVAVGALRPYAPHVTQCAVPFCATPAPPRRSTRSRSQSPSSTTRPTRTPQSRSCGAAASAGCSARTVRIGCSPWRPLPRRRAITWPRCRLAWLAALAAARLRRLLALEEQAVAAGAPRLVRSKRQGSGSLRSTARHKVTVAFAAFEGAILMLNTLHWGGGV